MFPHWLKSVGFVTTFLVVLGCTVCLVGSIASLGNELVDLLLVYIGIHATAATRVVTWLVIVKIISLVLPDPSKLKTEEQQNASITRIQRALDAAAIKQDITEQQDIDADTVHQDTPKRYDVPDIHT